MVQQKPTLPDLYTRYLVISQRCDEAIDVQTIQQTFEELLNLVRNMREK